MNPQALPLGFRRRAATLRAGLCVLLALVMVLGPLVQAAAGVHGLAHGEQSHLALAHSHSQAHSQHSGHGHGHDANPLELLHALAHAAHACAPCGPPSDAWPRVWIFERVVLALTEAPVRGGIESRDGPFRPPISA